MQLYSQKCFALVLWISSAYILQIMSCR